MMTGSELYKEFFELPSLMRAEFKETMRQYDFLAGDATRTDEQEADLERLRKLLLNEFQWEAAPPVPRGPARMSRGRRQT
jgi:hypothetical protein